MNPPRSGIQPKDEQNGRNQSISISIELENGAYLPDTQAIRLLADIRKTGSISRAANKQEMSYATAWRRLKEAEAALGMTLLLPQKGGARGGGTRLTEQGGSFVVAYINMLNEAERLVGECVARHFPALSPHGDEKYESASFSKREY